MGWINQQSQIVKKEYRPYDPSTDSDRVLTIVAGPSVASGAGGPTAGTITRIAIMSLDKQNVIEPMHSGSTESAWHNAFGPQ
jgi:hypothetical protein